MNRQEAIRGIEKYYKVNFVPEVIVEHLRILIQEPEIDWKKIEKIISKQFTFILKETVRSIAKAIITEIAR